MYHNQAQDCTAVTLFCRWKELARNPRLFSLNLLQVPARKLLESEGIINVTYTYSTVHFIAQILQLQTLLYALLIVLHRHVHTLFYIHMYVQYNFTNCHFEGIELKSRFWCGSPFFIWFLLPPRAWLLPGMQISSINFVRTLSTLNWRNSGVSKGR